MSKGRGAGLRRTLVAAALTVVTPGSMALAQAQEPPYPSKPIRMIVPYAAGASGADNLARLLGPKLTERWGAPIVIENRAMASAVPGHTEIARAAPNGYTVGMSATSFTTTVALVQNLPYDPIKSFDRLALLATNVVGFVVAPKVPASSMKEFMELARRQPGKLNYASPGNGTPQHLAMELFKLESKLDIVHVPYKSSGSALPDLISGNVQAMAIPLQTAAPYLTNGKLHMLSVMSGQRAAAFPTVPTLRELGLPSIEVDTWYGSFAPAGLPPAVIVKWNTEFNSLLQLPDVRQAMEKQGMTPGGGTPERFTRLLEDDIARWKRVVSEAHIHAD